MHLGSIYDYEKTLLDFQLQKIDPKKFKDLETYLKTNGLNKKKSVLFLHIRKELNYEKKKRLKNFSSQSSFHSHHMLRQSQSGSNQDVIHYKTISRNQTYRQTCQTNIPEKNKRTESPSTSQRVPCSLTQAIRNINILRPTHSNNKEHTEPYLKTTLSELPISSSKIEYSSFSNNKRRKHLNDNYFNKSESNMIVHIDKQPTRKRSRSFSSDSGLSSFGGSMRINQEINERNRKKQNNEIENQHIPGIISVLR
jgi:hypothetical protein